MNISVTTDDDAVVLNELGPVLVFAIAFVIAMGGLAALGIAMCGWGRVQWASMDFWRGIAKLQCK